MPGKGLEFACENPKAKDKESSPGELWGEVFEHWKSFCGIEGLGVF